MGYTTDASMVRVDFFKPSGKWYTTEAVRVPGTEHWDKIENFKAALKSHLEGRLNGMTAVALEDQDGVLVPWPFMVHIPEGGL